MASLNTLGFALERANAKMVRGADLWRRRNRTGERFASSADQSSDSEWASVHVASESAISNTAILTFIKVSMIQT